MIGNDYFADSIAVEIAQAHALINAVHLHLEVIVGGEESVEMGVILPEAVFKRPCLVGGIALVKKRRRTVLAEDAEAHAGIVSMAVGTMVGQGNGKIGA